MLSDKGIAEIEKTPEPIRQIGAKDGKGQFKACYQKRAQPDFKGTLTGGQSVVFEAKHTDGEKIQQSAVTEEQRRRLSAHYELGAKVFVLVSAGFENFYRVPWGVWLDMSRRFGHKHMTLTELEPYRIMHHNGILRFLREAADDES